jgi:aconitate hydratase
MIRGTFANVRLRNKLVDKEGGFTRYFATNGAAGSGGAGNGGADATETTIYEAAMRYAAAGVPLVVLAGKEYGSGSSRDWAAKGTALLGVRAVIAESFERIHRSNLIGMGVVPLQLPDGETVESLGLSGEETIGVSDLENGGAKTVTVTAARGPDVVEFEARVRIDTPNEVTYFRNGGILHRVLRDLKSRG